MKAFVIGPRAVFAFALSVALALAVVACSASQKASFTKAMTGHTDPASTQPATPGSVEGVTQTIGDGASVGAAATGVVPGNPLQALLLAVAAAAPTILVLERLAVRLVASLPNSQGSGSNSGSGGPTPQGAPTATAGGNTPSTSTPAGLVPLILPDPKNKAA